ncbi:hypothetical protein IGI04_025584, partial [Brassica rapa subsp. trilocularis]
MNKQIEELRASQTQQSEEIRKDLGGEISALKDIIEKYFANSPPFNQREGKQAESSSDLTAADTNRRPVPPDRFPPDQTAAKIAKLHELSLAHTPAKTSRPAFNSSQRSSFTQNKNQYSSTTPTTPNTTSNQNKPILATPPHKRISFDEMQERKRKGLCMYCDEQFTPGHQLKHRRSEFLLLEADPTEFDEEIALEEQIRETTIEDEDDK